MRLTVYFTSRTAVLIYSDSCILLQHGVIENPVIKITWGVQKFGAVVLHWSLKSRNSTQRDRS